MSGNSMMESTAGRTGMAREGTGRFGRGDGVISDNKENTARRNVQ